MARRAGGGASVVMLGVSDSFDIVVDTAVDTADGWDAALKVAGSRED
jgi:hypothetical protein